MVDTLRSVTFNDIRGAAERLRGVAHRTPVVTSRTLDERTGAQVFLKAENLQRMGAFKFRGAYNRIAQLDESQRRAGVIAFSSGNHAQGVALACKLLGVPATIVMPSDAPAAKIAATRGYGAEVVLYDRHTEDRAAIAQRLAGETGATIVPPYDDAAVIAGQGTATMELLEDVESLDIVVCPVGGGGLLAGTAIAAHGHDAATQIYGVEPEAGNDFAQSMARGERVHIPVPATIADGQQTQSPGEITFRIAREERASIVTVTDDQIREAMRFAFERLKLVVEPSGASALAAVLSGVIPARGKRVGIIISGGNVDAARFATLLS